MACFFRNVQRSALLCSVTSTRLPSPLYPFCNRVSSSLPFFSSTTFSACNCHWLFPCLVFIYVSSSVKRTTPAILYIFSSHAVLPLKQRKINSPEKTSSGLHYPEVRFGCRETRKQEKVRARAISRHRSYSGLRS